MMQETGDEHARDDGSTTMSSFTYIGTYDINSGIPIDIQHLIIHEHVDYLPTGFCAQRQQLLQIEFPSRLILIGNRAFADCTALTQVAFPSHLISIGYAAFSTCTSLMNVSLPEGLQRIGMHSFSDCLALQRVQVPSTVETIGDWAFFRCRALMEVILLEGLINIGANAFHECSLLRDIELPDTVETIGHSAFKLCQSLCDIRLSSRCQLFPSVFSDCSSLEKIEIPSSVDSIPVGLLWRCSSLTNVTLHDGLRQIGDGSFLQASSLVTIKLSSATTLIGFGAFRGCASLEEVGLYEGLLEICPLAFMECVSLSRIKVPSTVNTIGGLAFSGCVNLVSMEFSPSRQGPLRIGDRAFDRCQSLINFALPSETELSVNVHETIMPQIDMEVGCMDTSRVFFDRFDGDQIHEKCYHSCDTTLNELRQELEDGGQQHTTTSGYERLMVHSDIFEMTPFHVLLSAASFRLDLLELLLQAYPSFVLDWKDILGRRAVDYLSSASWNQETRAMMESYLDKWFIERLAGCGINGWRSDMTHKVLVVVLEEDRERRNSAVGDAYGRMKKYEKAERMALLELALWKNAMVPCANNGSTTLSSVSDREGHHANCGATFAVPNVIAYLENGFQNNDAERYFRPSL